MSKNFAFCQITDNRIYLCEQQAEEIDEKLNFEVVARGKQASVAFDKNGVLYIARLTNNGNLYIAKRSDMSNEILIASEVDSFDISRSNINDISSLICVYVVDHAVYKRELVFGNWKTQTQISLPNKVLAQRVKFARGAITHNVLIITDINGLNHVMFSSQDIEVASKKNIKSVCQTWVY